MSRLCVFWQTGWFIAGLMAGLPASAAPTETSSVAGVAVGVGGGDTAGCASHVTGHAVLPPGDGGAGAA